MEVLLTSRMHQAGGQAGGQAVWRCDAQDILCVWCTRQVIYFVFDAQDIYFDLMHKTQTLIWCTSLCFVSDAQDIYFDLMHKRIKKKAAYKIWATQVDRERGDVMHKTCTLYPLCYRVKDAAYLKSEARQWTESVEMQWPSRILSSQSTTAWKCCFSVYIKNAPGRWTESVEIWCTKHTLF